MYCFQMVGTSSKEVSIPTGIFFIAQPPQPPIIIKNKVIHFHFFLSWEPEISSNTYNSMSKRKWQSLLLKRPLVGRRQVPFFPVSCLSSRPLEPSNTCPMSLFATGTVVGERGFFCQSFCRVRKVGQLWTAQVGRTDSLIYTSPFQQKECHGGANGMSRVVFCVPVQ